MWLLPRSWIGAVTTAVQNKKKLAGIADDTAKMITGARHIRFCVTGNEAAGKSSVITRIVHWNILPRGEGIITRQCLLIELRFNAAATTPKFVLTLAGQTTQPVVPLTTSDPTVVENALRANHDAIKASGKGFDPRISVLRVESAAVPNLDLVDTPGLLAVPQEGEPEDMAKLAESIARGQLEEKDVIPLIITEAHENSRNSPMLALIKVLKPATYVRVATKADHALEADWDTDTGNESPLSSYFRKMPSETITLRNFNHTNLADMTAAETVFFAKYMSAKEKEAFGESVGIESLLRRLNTVAEKTCRPEWKKLRDAEEKATLAKIQTDLASIGPVMTSQQIAQVVSAEMFPTPSAFETFVLAVFNEQKYAVPSAGVWESRETTCDIEQFYMALRAKLANLVKTVFQKQALRLARFATFCNELVGFLQGHLDAQHEAFLKHWSKLQNFLKNCHDVDPDYDPGMWQRAALTCTLQNVFLPLAKVPKPPFDFSQALSSHCANFSNAETDAVTQRRTQLMQQEQTMREVIALL